jgi:transposase InsO family protein
MQQIYHSNAKTNSNIREHIQHNSTVSNRELATQFNVSLQTISKWKNRDFLADSSSRPKNIKYALSDVETALIISIRKSSWLPLDEIFEMVLPENPTLSRSSVYRTFLRHKINKLPQTIKAKAQLFKAYEPGFLHVDVTYLPKFNGRRSYLFVAIDRATRLMFYAIYDDKSALSTDAFFDKCLDFFPFEITHILTDNGLEFTNRLIKSKKGNLCSKPSLLDIKCVENNIEHRLTKPSSPQTNGMVERANGTIKNNTILKNTYANQQEMHHDLLGFLAFYNLFRRHGSLRKELNVKTPFDAVQKWFDIKPEIFKLHPVELKSKLLDLNKYSLFPSTIL